jgi:hypothetical protein
MTVNAFHPDFMKTHHPEFMKDHVLSSRGSMVMSKIVEEKRRANPSHGTLYGISKITPVALKPKDFMIFSRAGAPKK